MIQKLTPSINPIIVKELRSRMRGARPFITLTVMLLLLSVITYGVYRLSLSVMSYYSGSAISPQIGQSLFTMLSFLLLLFICIITPAVTANAISSEKEQLTYEMLLSTPLAPSKILWGKLFSALSYVFLLILSAIPIFSLIFVFGGVTLRDIVKTLIVLIVITISLGVFGIFMSSLMKRSARATVLSYVLIAVIILGSFVTYAIVGVIQNAVPPRWLLVMNPVSILASAISGMTSNYDSIMAVVPILGADLGTLAGDTIGLTHIPRPLYHFSLPLYGFLSIFFYFGATRLVLPTRKGKISRQEILIFLAFIVVVLAISLGAFFLTTGSYEQAVFDSSNQALFGGVMVEPAVQEIRVVAEPVAIPDGEEIIIPDSLADQTNFYTTAIIEAINEFSEERGTAPERIFFVTTVIDSIGGEDYSFTFPEPLQLALVESLSKISPEITWVDTPEEVFDNPKLNIGVNDYVLNIGDMHWLDDQELSFYITISINNAVEWQAYYTYTQTEKDLWEITSIEKVFDAAETN
ncbi:ABC transporter permease [bacterium]|nr:ABC transporter permease [bacterium]